jgi:protein TonB
MVILFAGGWLWSDQVEAPQQELARGEPLVIPSVRLLTPEEFEQLTKPKPRTNMRTTVKPPPVAIAEPLPVDVTAKPVAVRLPGLTVEPKRDDTRPLPDPAKADMPDYQIRPIAIDPPTDQPTDDSPPKPVPTQAKPTPPASTDKPQGVSRGAEIVDLPSPKYPTISRRLGEQGVVLLGATVDASGRANNIKLVRGPGHPRLVTAAIDALRQARFRPALRNGQPTTQYVEIPYSFQLRD